MIKKYVKERDAALLSLDKRKIQLFMQNYCIPVPKDETIFWAGVHKAILHINAASREQRFDSLAWLIEHGFSPDIY